MPRCLRGMRLCFSADLSAPAARARSARPLTRELRPGEGRARASRCSPYFFMLLQFLAVKSALWSGLPPLRPVGHLNLLPVRISDGECDGAGLTLPATLEELLPPATQWCTSRRMHKEEWPISAHFFFKTINFVFDQCVTKLPISRKQDCGPPPRPQVLHLSPCV
jgi:hypothetical protein